MSVTHICTQRHASFHDRYKRNSPAKINNAKVKTYGAFYVAIEDVCKNYCQPF